ncbi:acyl carrier protein, partial [Rhodovulum sulfidophilum]
FFEAGGSSLLAVRLQAALSRAAGRDVPIHIVFDHPTVLAQAAAFSPKPQPPARAASRRRFRQMAQSRGSTTRG